MDGGLAVLLLLALFGAVGLLLAVRRALDRRPWPAAGHALLGVLLLSVAFLAWPVVVHLGSYDRLLFESPVADIEFEQTGPRQYLATLTRLPGGRMQVFELAGDEWQMDARLLKWRGWALALGFQPRFRLERLSGRYTDIDDERSERRTVHELGSTRGRDLWALARSGGRWTRILDAEYGSATYVPMADGAIYRVTLSKTGLVARPRNAEAEQAVASNE